MALEWMESVLTKIENETPNTKRFYFEIPNLEKFDFIPGQFVTLDLPIHEQKKTNAGEVIPLPQNRMAPILSNSLLCYWKLV